MLIVGKIDRDGGTTSMTVPSAFAQSEAILKAYSQVGITNMNETGYFECHGTGTPTGDPIEVSAVSKVFAPTRADDDFLWIGSVSATSLGEESISISRKWRQGNQLSD